MILAYFFAEIVLNHRLGFWRRDGEIGGGHPVDEIPFEDRGIASDDPAPFVGGKLFRVWERREEVVNTAVYVFLDWRSG